MKITPVKLRGKVRFKLESRGGGTRTRQFFKTMADAVAAQKVILKTQAETGRGFAVLTASQKTSALAFIAKVRATGYTYEQVLEILDASICVHPSNRCPRHRES